MDDSSKGPDDGFERLKDRKNWTKDGVPVLVDIDSAIEYIAALPDEDLDFDGPNGGYLRSLCFWCSLERMPEVLDLFSRSGGNTNTKRLFLQSLCRRVVIDNPYDGLTQAFEITESKFGGSALARDMRRYLISTEGFTLQSLGLIRSIESKKERSALLAGLNQSLLYEADISNVKNLDLQSLNQEEKEVLVSALALRYDDPSGQGRSAAEMLNESIGVLSRPDDVSNLLSKFSRHEPRVVLSYLEASAGKLTAEQMTEVESQAIENLARLDGKAAMQLAKADIGTELFGDVFEAFMRVDPHAAEKWFVAERAGLESEQLEMVLSVSASNHVRNEDLSEAKRVLAEIEDPALRKKVGDEIWPLERRALVKEVDEDPSGTIQGILDEESVYQAYWLETAMGAWMEQDFDQAAAWHEETWETLPPGKSQYIAAAFAKRALKEGDIKMAREWLIHISGERTAARVRAAIERAALAFE